MLLAFFREKKEIPLYRYLISEKELIIEYKYQDKTDRRDKRKEKYMLRSLDTRPKKTFESWWGSENQQQRTFVMAR